MTPETRGFAPASSASRAPSVSTEATLGPASPRFSSPELMKSLAEVKGQTQFLLYLTDQIEDSIQQLARETDEGQSAFLGRLLAMYASQLETKHQGLGEKIAETCQEVYVAVRELEMDFDE